MKRPATDLDISSRNAAEDEEKATIPRYMTDASEEKTLKPPDKMAMSEPSGDSSRQP